MLVGDTIGLDKEVVQLIADIITEAKNDVPQDAEEVFTTRALLKLIKIGVVQDFRLLPYLLAKKN